MNNKKQLLACVVLTAVFVVRAISAEVLVTNYVRAVKGIGLSVNYGGGPSYGRSYDKPSLSCKTANIENKGWIGWDLTAVWAQYGQANLTNASLILWDENTINRDLQVSLLSNGVGDDWGQDTITFTTAPGNTSYTADPGSTALRESFDWSKCYGGNYLFQVNTAGACLGLNTPRPDLLPSGNFDQCAVNYTTNTLINSNLVVWLKTDTDGLVTMMAAGNGTQSWWLGTNGAYTNDMTLGYTSTNTDNGTYGQQIRDTPTLKLVFTSQLTPPGAPVFTNIMLAGANIILQGSNGVPQGAYQMLRSPDLGQPPGSWLGLGIKNFDTNGNFNFTNALPAVAASFYRLMTLSSGPVYPPTISAQPQDLNLGAGQNAMFSVTATGTDLTYRWYYNTNNLLASGTSSAYTRNNAQTNDSGKYSVTVSNLLGVVPSVFATLTVTNPPLPVAPAGLTATPGILQVSLSWNAVSGATSYIVKRSTVNGSAYVNIATNAATSYLDTGLVNGTPYYYVVSAVNATGEGADSGQASATPVNANPVTVANFGFEAPTTGNFIYTPIGYSWTFDSGSGVTANNSTFTSGIPDAPEGVQVGFLKGLGTLSQTISGLVPGVSYVITFAAANRGGGYPTKQAWDVQIDNVTKASFANVPTSYANYTASFTATATSHVLKFIGKVNADATVFLDNVRIAYPSQPPGIVTQPTNVSLSIGLTAQFSVLANGALPLSYQWYYNTNTLLTGQTSNTLTLANVQSTNAGKYSVTITNVNGSVTSAFATLTVTADPPTITGQPVNQGRAIGQSAVFSVTTIGTAPLSYQWYYNTNTLLTGETNLTLTVFNAGTNQAGKYSVLVANANGSTNSAFATLTVTNALLAFPEAEGYGKYTVGGRGGSVYEVTNLNATGPGSFGTAISVAGRTVVFRVAGTITGDFSINKNNITIAGQTAPGDGICIKGNLNLNANDLIIRYIRCRPNTATDPEVDAIGGRFINNVILDHVSASWSGDETMTIYHGSNVTIQWSMISEACVKFLGGTNTGHQFGGIWGNNYGTYHHNLIAHNVSRNPRWASGCGYNDYRNNVLYNWDYESCYGGEAVQTGAETLYYFSTINMIANYNKAGPATQSGVRSRIANPSARDSSDKGSWYVSGNYVDGYPSVTANNWTGVAGSSYIKLTAPWTAMPINEQTATSAYTNVLAKVGCFKPNRDSVDAQIVQDVTTGTAAWGVNGILTYPTDAGGGWPVLATGTPPVDSDHDGMPDDWEALYPGILNPGIPDQNIVAPNGYTYLENYINQLGAF